MLRAHWQWREFATKMALINCSMAGTSCGGDGDVMNYSFDANSTGVGGGGGGDNGTGVALSVTFASLYAAICVIGLIGNGLVIFVVLRYAKMKTVTNMYILNLAVADLCFLIGLPFLITTLLLKSWVFGYAMCKLFYIQTSINWFTSVFTFTVMSADRYLAVCHPISSMRYRTPVVARIVCIVVWTLSLLVMLPIILYAQTVDSPSGQSSCTIIWPDGQLISPDQAFIWYALLLGFAIPVALISVFYALVLIRLRTVGPKAKSKEKKRTHRKVTKMVLTVIAAYVVCWLPYWVFQVVLTFADYNVPLFVVYVFQVITVMSYANSILNPLLYAFLSENFRNSFVKAFKCAAKHEVDTALKVEQSVCARRKSHAAAPSHPPVKPPMRTDLLAPPGFDDDMDVPSTLATSTTRLGSSIADTSCNNLAIPVQAPISYGCHSAKPTDL